MQGIASLHPRNSARETRLTEPRAPASQNPTQLLPHVENKCFCVSRKLCLLGPTSRPAFDLSRVDGLQLCRKGGGSVCDSGRLPQQRYACCRIPIGHLDPSAAGQNTGKQHTGTLCDRVPRRVPPLAIPASHPNSKHISFVAIRVECLLSKSGGIHALCQPTNPFFTAGICGGPSASRSPQVEFKRNLSAACNWLSRSTIAYTHELTKPETA